MMDVFERYFQFTLCGICGIPTITLEGTTSDWERLYQKAAALDIFDLDWWLAHLLPLCDQFVRASRGDVDLGHWRGICKLRDEYGGDVINGWVAKLFPYLRAFIDGPCDRRNPIFETGEGFQTWVAPSGLSRVPFLWRDTVTGRERRMEAIGGLVGVTQERRTLALRPKVGWAVREAGHFDALLARLTADHTTFPGVRTDGRTWQRFAWLADGSWLAINLDQNRRNLRPTESRGRDYDLDFSPICRGAAETQGRPGQNPVIALSFTELLERMLGQSGTPYWLDPRFTGYGDAEQYTRRDRV
jgi:hypothetical protein